MAKIKFGMMMTDARGKLGGQVFSKNAAGAYVRTKVTPTNPRTTSQTSVRALFGSISQQWSALTEEVRKQFRTAVSDWARTDVFGDLKNPTGKALFQRLNNQAQAAGLPAVVTVPQKLEMPDEIVDSVGITISAGEVKLNNVNTDAATQIVISATAQLSAGTKFVKNRLRQIEAVSGSALTETGTYSAYVSKFGVPATGDNIYFGVKYVLASGQASPMQTIKAVIIA